MLAFDEIHSDDLVIGTERPETNVRWRYGKVD
jgi:hypothetical protein